MSIIDCPKCGKENISETVLKCPACGFKVKAYFDKLKKEEESFKSYSVEEIESLQRATIAKRPMFNQELGIGLGTLAFVVFMFICEYTIIGFIGCIIAFMFLFTGISNLREEQALYDQYKDDAEKYIEAQYKFAGMDAVKASVGKDFVVEADGVKLVTLTMDEARFVRKLSGKVYLGEACDLYEADG